MSSPATARQLGRIDALIAERDTALVVLPRRISHLDLPAASHLITELERCPRRAVDAPRRGAAPVNLNGAGAGVYEIGGDVFRLRVNRGGTGVYPERLVLHERPARWVYAPDVARRILPSQRIDEATAAAMGRESLVCVLCGTPLEDPDSIARGIGPKCRRKVLAR